MSAAGTLVGLEVPERARRLEVKPYGIGGATTDLVAEPPVRGAGHGDVGVDAKYALTRNLTVDFTHNTDFAQVEVDEQQVNLTRFSLFFPEKREFFLEGRGIFEYELHRAAGQARCAALLILKAESLPDDHATGDDIGIRRSPGFAPEVEPRSHGRDAQTGEHHPLAVPGVAVEREALTTALKHLVAGSQDGHRGAGAHQQQGRLEVGVPASLRWFLRLLRHEAGHLTLE